jgi:hypothetical protein
MAQHDYIIANQSGAAFRSDLNNGLAAIVSQNSGAAQPSTTYAYQWWADTTTGLLKLRNAANNAWITLFQLDGEWTTLAIENGTAAAPSLYFKDSGTDTGLFSPGADQFGIATGGVERVEFGTTEVVFNDGGADVDFRVEGDTKADLFLVDASADAVLLGSQANLRWADADSSNYIAVQAPSTVSSNVTFTLPSADGTSGQFLSTNGSGTLSFAKAVPAGTIQYFAGSSAPDGYLKANGATISRTTYADLFTAIGTTFGVGDGSTTFGIPDLRGEFARGWDDARGVDSGRAFGSAQNATRINTVSASNYIADEVENSVSSSETRFSYISPFASTKSLGQVRPRNIALLAIIKF